MTELPAASEHLEQCAYFRWLAWAYPNVIAFAIPNGGLRDKRVAAKLRDEGVKPGIPDIMLAEPVGAWPGLFVEMKSKRGVVSPAQKLMIARLRQKGYKVEVAYGWTEAKDVTERYFKLGLYNVGTTA